MCTYVVAVLTVEPFVADWRFESRRCGIERLLLVALFDVFFVNRNEWWWRPDTLIINQKLSLPVQKV